ncbi:MAG TPA: HNH endonuclease signature motif containing protein [Verrucomicrobiae bacterium]|nr:HNH endonuclease signature motif containing protein [Verrucomicrobiae bacterium]
MYRDYLQLRSIKKTAELYGRSRSTILQTFKNHDLPLTVRKSHPTIIYQGRRFWQDKNGYYNCRGKLLHHILWEQHTGRKVPRGWQVGFKNKNNLDFRPENLYCATLDEILSRNRPLENPKRIWSRNRARLAQAA